MQQIINQQKQKALENQTLFVSVNSTWCTIADVKITFDELDDVDVQEIIELLNEKLSALLQTS